MARLVRWPVGLGKVSYERLTGPRTAGASATESIQGFVQTVASSFGSWRFRLSLQAMKGRKFRLYRGMIEGLHGGANAVRIPFHDPDIMTFAEAGVVGVPDHVTHPEVAWSNGKPWSNGKNWGASRPPVAVSEAADVDTTIINLADTHWGHNLIGGEWIGFFPFHLGLYVVTQVLDEGEYRVWPPLRKSLTTSTYATLYPVMAVRLEGEAGGSVQRGPAASEGNVMTVLEVRDSLVRSQFAD